MPENRAPRRGAAAEADVCAARATCMVPQRTRGRGSAKTSGNFGAYAGFGRSAWRAGYRAATASVRSKLL